MVGAAIERLVVRRSCGRPLDTILATWGLSLIIAQAIAWIFGRGPQTLGHTLLSEVLFGYSAYRVLLIALAALLLFTLALVVRNGD